MADEKEIKKLSGESRVDALVLELKQKFGFQVSPATFADAIENKDAREAAGIAEPKFEKGETVLIADHEPPDEEFSIEDVKFEGAAWLYTLKDKDGKESTQDENKLLPLPEKEEPAPEPTPVPEEKEEPTHTV